MVCEECARPIWEELKMSKEERVAYELGLNRSSRSLIWIIISFLIGSLFGYLLSGGVI